MKQRHTFGLTVLTASAKQSRETDRWMLHRTVRVTVSWGHCRVESVGDVLNYVRHIFKTSYLLQTTR